MSRAAPVTVVDYGLGNVHSVLKALRAVGAEPTLASDPAAIAGAARLVVPGVGAFADGMRRLRDAGLNDAIVAHARAGRPLLGICLGMQLLFQVSEEFGEHDGLGLLEGRVVPLTAAPGRKVPQIGWNRIFAPVGSGRAFTASLLSGVAESNMFYFVHSFTAAPREADRLADADYLGLRVSAAVAKDNVVGLQFHPEKSGPAGLAILSRYLQC